ncbi:MAG: DUF2974 domain-containing protein [Treponema sp.]|jgi:hypothetical protein|nr:DUF2974 domain-containing protein [Treponema sp.]
MGFIFDYLAWRGDLTLRQSPFNAVDNVILTHLSYLPLSGIVPGPEDSRKNISIGAAAKLFGESLNNPSPGFERHLLFRDDPALFEALGSSRRYSSMELTGFTNQLDPAEGKQFAALTILTGDKHIFVAYRGTDNTLTGWKEDFNMAFSDEVPSQLEAVKYLEIMANRFKKPLRAGGHSKGGNLAVYAASFCSKSVRKRIKEIYINDAPGFSNKVIAYEGYQAIRGKIISFIPENSVVGMLFKHDYDDTVIKSSKNGILQHDVYSWEVMGNDLVRLEGINRESRFIDQTVKEWLASLNKEQFKEFTEALFVVLGSTEVNSLLELGTGWLKNVISMIQSFHGIDKHSKDMLLKTLRSLAHAARKNIRILIPNDNS